MPLLDPLEDAVQFHRPRGFESAFRAHRNSVNIVGVAAGAFVTLDITAEDYDYLNECNLVTNQFVASENGVYDIVFQVGIRAATNGSTISTVIDDGGGTVRSISMELYHTTSTTNMTNRCHFQGFLTAGLACRPQYFISAGVAYTVIGDPVYTYFVGHRVR